MTDHLLAVVGGFLGGALAGAAIFALYLYTPRRKARP